MGAVIRKVVVVVEETRMEAGRDVSPPTRRAAAAPASVAAFTEPTSPRTIAVTSPASTFCQPTNSTFAVFSMASAASTMPTSPRVSTMPRASPTSRFSLSAIRQTLYHRPRGAHHDRRSGSAPWRPHANRPTKFEAATRCPGNTTPASARPRWRTTISANTSRKSVVIARSRPCHRCSGSRPGHVP